MQPITIQTDKTPPIYKICLTGGPCGGKTTALEKLKEHLAKKGFKVFAVPELGTLTLQGGGMLLREGLDQENTCQFMGLFMDAQINMEDYFYKIAQMSKKPSIILYDRGIIDIKGYIGQEQWQTLLDSKNQNEVYLRDQRYDVIIHMITTADGAQEYYTSHNNEHRNETQEQAIQLDQKLQQAYVGHPHQIIIDNNQKNKGFESKIQQVYKAVEKYIGLSTEGHIFQKYLVKQINEEQMVKENPEIQKFNVEEVYLTNFENRPNFNYAYIRKRGSHGSYSYSYTVRLNDKNNKKQREVSKVSINAQQYIQYFQYRDSNMGILKKTKFAFIKNNQSCTVEKFEDVRKKQICILRVDSILNQEDILQQQEEENGLKKQFEPPKWILEIKDITNNSKYESKYFAQINQA